MYLIVLFVLQSLAFLSLFNSGIHSETVASIFIVVNVVTASILILKKEEQLVALILIIALLTRVVVLLIDLYTSIPLLYSGVDSETFHTIACDNLQVGKIIRTLTPYTDFLTYMYSVFTSNRLFAQYLNIVLGVSTILVFIKILKALNIDYRKNKKWLMLASFFPSSVLLSSILLRDIFVIYFSTLSIFFFIRWFQKGGYKDVVLTFVSVIVASIMHSGIIFISVGYLIGFSFWDRSRQSMRITRRSFGYFALIAIFILLLLTFSSSILSKFNRLDDGNLDEVLSSTRVSAGSLYLTWINPESPLQVVLFSPLKALYFLFSPMPWNWRGFADIISFIVDSLVYFYFIQNIVLNYKYTRTNKLWVLLFISMIGVVLVYSWGVVAAGTAMRHRVKILYLLMILSMFSNKIKNEKTD